MKSNYNKYIEEVWDMKDNALNDFKKSGFTNYVDYIKNELKSEKLLFAKEKKTNKRMQ